MQTKRELRRIAERAEQRANHHFTKLWNIDKLVKAYEEDHSLNPYYLVKSIRKELDKPLIKSSSN